MRLKVKSFWTCGVISYIDELDILERRLYDTGAVKLLGAIEEKYCNWNPEEDAIVDFGSAKYHRESDREVPIIYGDYFFIEGILRLVKKSFLIW